MRKTPTLTYPTISTNLAIQPKLAAATPPLTSMPPPIHPKLKAQPRSTLHEELPSIKAWTHRRNC
jgi:hypothetical protein